MTETSTPRSLFCFGLGYTARRLAEGLRAEGWRVAGTAREPGAGGNEIPIRRFDRDHPLADAHGALAGVTHLLISIPPDADGDPVLDAHADAIAAADALEWIGYLSTTAVYGDHEGGWVDEDTPPAPTSPRARARAQAERLWLNYWWGHGIPVQIFRLAGIYGPGRSALDQLRAGTAKRIDKPGQVFSRIHVDDIAAVLRASIARPRGGAVYNVCDDRPAPPGDVVAFAAALLGLDPPPPIPFEEAALSPMARGFYADNKRVRNARIKRELGVALRYPDYESGLRAILEGEGR